MAEGFSSLAKPANSNTPPEAAHLVSTAINSPADLSAGAQRIHHRNHPINRGLLRATLKSIDIAAAILVAWFTLSLTGNSVLHSSVSLVLPFALIPAAVRWGLKASESYALSYARPVTEHMIRSCIGAGYGLAALCALTAIFYDSTQTRWVMGASYLTFCVIIAVHAHFIVLFKVFTRNGVLSENVVLVGATPNAQRLLSRNGETRELNVVGVFDDRLSRAPKTMEGVPVLGRLDDLMNWERLPEIDRIVVTVTSDARHRVRELIDRLRVLPQRVVLLLDLEGFDPETESLAEIARSPAAYVSGAPDDTRRATMKRASDILFASLMLVAFSPVLLLTALAVKLDSPGPILFRQRRQGFNNQVIRVWKFRSMRHDPVAAERMSRQTESDDERVTRVGKFIRACSLDELPQLINVLRGEMSIVGPRPHALGMTAENDEVQAIVGDYAHRHRVKPGITGWAQVNGSRGPVHTREEVRDRIRLDMEYVNRASFWFDLFIMLITAPCLLGDFNRQR